MNNSLVNPRVLRLYDLLVVLAVLSFEDFLVVYRVDRKPILYEYTIQKVYT